MRSTNCRRGIMSTATISRKTWQAIQKAGNSQLVAVASRDVRRSKDFIAECNAKVPAAGPVEAYGDYDALLQNPNVDAVYQKALKAGGASTMEPTDMFYGDRGASVKDPAGIAWYMATHTEDVSMPELEKRARKHMDEMAKTH